VSREKSVEAGVKKLACNVLVWNGRSLRPPRLAGV